MASVTFEIQDFYFTIQGNYVGKNVSLAILWSMDISYNKISNKISVKINKLQRL